MNFLKKVAALLLAVMILVSTTACGSKDESWSYKVGDTQLSKGIYMFALLSYYSQAQTLASEDEKYDANKSFLNIKVQGENDESPIKAKNWIVEKTDEMCRAMLVVATKCKEYGIELSEETLTSIQESAQSDWTNGPYYEYYQSLGYESTPYQDILEPYGITYEDFEYAAYTTSELQYQLFLKLYGEGGDMEVPKDELATYFLENYTDYKYISVSLTNTVTDSESDEESTTAMTETEVANVKKELEAYVTGLNNGKMTWDDVTTDYQVENELTSDPTVSGTEVIENSYYLSQNLIDALNSLDEGKATIVESGEDTSAVMYIIYKGKIADQQATYIDDETYVEGVLVDCKSTDFSDYIDSLTDTIGISKNRAVTSKYKPYIFMQY